MKQLTKEEMKSVVGGQMNNSGECSTSTSCPGGYDIKCSSNGADSNPQGGESCQKVDGMMVTCYDSTATNGWTALTC